MILFRYIVFICLTLNIGFSQALGNFIFINGSWSPSRTPYIFDYINNTWSEALMTNNSGGEQNTHIAYDSKNKKLMSVRQLSNSNQVFIDAYDPLSNTWETRSSFEAPNIYGNMDVAYDSENSKIILCFFYGTLYRYSYDYETDSWETLEQGGIGSHNKSDMAYDIESDKMIYVVSWSNSLQTISYDYNSDSYESKSTLEFSGTLDDIAVTYDSENDRVLLAILKEGYIYFSTYDYNSDTWVLIDTNDTGDGNHVHENLNYINIAYDIENDITLITSSIQEGSYLYTYAYDLNTENFFTVSSLDAGYLNGYHDLVFINNNANNILINHNGNGTASTYLYNYNTDLWQERAYLEGTWDTDASAAYDSESDKVILVYNSGSGIGLTKIYDHGTDTWTALDNSPQGFSEVISSGVYDVESDKVIFITYNGSSGGIPKVFDYNDQNWEQMENPIGGFGLNRATGAYDIESDRSIFFAHSSSNWMNTKIYDYNTDTWETDGANLGVGTYFGWSTASYDIESDKVIFIRYSGNAYATVYAYDYNTNTWEEKESAGPGIDEYWGTSAYDPISDRVILIENNGNNFSTVRAFDYNTNTWEERNYLQGTDPYWGILVNRAELEYVGVYSSSTWHVSTSGSDENDGSDESPFATIQKGIDSASDEDTVLVSAGTYVENINYNGKNIVIKGENRETTIINGNQNGSVVYFTSNEDSTAVLENFTIYNGSSNIGGGILITDSASPTLMQLIIKENFSESNGAGIHVDNNAFLNISNSIIEFNQQTQDGWSGGGISLTNGSTALLDSVIIQNNSTRNWGGGVYLYTNSSAKIINSIIRDNTANVNGAGICSDVSELELKNSSILSNTSNNKGGGIYINGYADLEGNLISSNLALAGAGIYVANNTNSIPDIKNCTVVKNVVTDDTDASAIEATRGIVTNCIIWGNSGGEVTISHPSTNYTEISFSNIDMNLIGGGEGNINIDPRFCDFENNNYYLYDGSPCIGVGQDGDNIGAFNIGCANETVFDIDGNEYSTSIIGDQIWMTENLKVTKYRNGDNIINGTDIDGEWNNINYGAYYTSNENYSDVVGNLYDESYNEAFGALYNFYAIKDSRKIAPEGWRVPTDEDWMELEQYLGMDEQSLSETGWRGTNESNFLREENQNYWQSSNEEALNTYNFSARGGGILNSVSEVNDIRQKGFFYTSTAEIEGQDGAYYRMLSYSSGQIYRGSHYNHGQNDGFSVRCIKNDIEEHQGPIWHISTNGSDSNNGSQGAPFATIQKGIDSASDGDTVLVQPGTYVEILNYNGKDVKLISLAITTGDSSYIEETIIEADVGQDGDTFTTAISFTDWDLSNGVSTAAKLAGFTISNSFTGIFCSNYDSPEIHDLIIKNNTKGLIVSRQANVYNSNIFDNVTGIELNTAYEEQVVFNNLKLYRNNSTLFGSAAISSSESNAIFNKCVFYGNKWVRFSRGNYSFINCTFYDNVGDFEWWNEGSIKITNSIIRGDEHSLENQVFPNNVINITYSNLENDYDGTGNITGNPQFFSPENGNFTLQSNSPCIDSGDPDLDGDGNDYTTDIDDRDLDGTRLDMGAFYYSQGPPIYYGPVWYISSNEGSDEEGTGSEEYPFATIQNGIDASSNGDTVLVEAGTYVENINFNGKNILVQGEDRETTIIDGNQSGSVVAFVNGESELAIISGFTIQNGAILENGIGPTDHGTGVYIRQASSPKILNNIIQYNYAVPNSNTDYSGGGISIGGTNGGSPEIAYNIIRNNQAFPSGGGIFLFDAGDSTFVHNNLIINNSIAIPDGLTGFENHGGGVRIDQGKFYNNTVWNNYSQGVPNDVLQNGGDVRNNIIEYGSVGQGEYSYCLSPFTLSGPNNINSDPLFINENNNNYLLQWGSPAIDSGDPNLNGDGNDYTTDTDDQDPDGTRLDIGYYYFDQTDSEDPIISISTIEEEIGTEDNINIYWTATDNMVLDSVYVYFSNDSLSSLNLIDSLQAEIGGIGEYLFIIPDSVITNYAAFIITIFDGSGNSSSDTSDFFAIYDNTAPSVMVSEPSEGFSTLENELFTIEWTNSDNIGVHTHLFEYSSDELGLNYDTLLFTSNLSQANSEQFIISEVTNNARIKLTVKDEAGNSATDYSSQFSVIDNTPPFIEFNDSLNDTTVSIAEIFNLTWSSYDNAYVSYVNLDYRIGNNPWEAIIENETDYGFYNWVIPNEPTNNLSIRIIATDAVGLSDTSIVENIQVDVSFPVVQSSTPDSGYIDWNTSEFSFQFSQALDAQTINSNNINFNSLAGINSSTTLGYNILYDQSLSVVSLQFGSSVFTMDSITITFSDQIKNIYGYSLDGDNDGESGGDYSIMFTTPMLADFDNNGNINVEDLSQFIIGLDNDDYNYELGPFNGDIPHVKLNLDNNFNIEDIVGFAMMWNWYFTNNPTSFQALLDDGSISNIEMVHDSIFIDIPNGLSAYQIQIDYEPGNVVINSQNHDDRGEFFFTDRSAENGVYTIMATPNTKKLAIPIQIMGKNAQVSVSYKGMDINGELHGQMTRSKNIENLPDDFVLYANYPNPFNPQTRIDFGLPDKGFVSLKIYDIMGREITTLVHDVLTPGYKSIIWNATNKSGQPVSAGMYFYALQAKDFIQIKKMVLLK